MITKKPTDTRHPDPNPNRDSRQGETRDKSRPDTANDQGRLEKVGKLIDPLARDISDEEIFDPGANVPAQKRPSIPNAPDVKKQ